jgi:hypothetical protein
VQQHNARAGGAMGGGKSRRAERQVFHRRGRSFIAKTNAETNLSSRDKFSQDRFCIDEIMPCIPSGPCSSLILCCPQIINCPNGRHQAPRADRRTDRTRAPFRELRE